MENNLKNHMATTTKRKAGRPTIAEVAARPPAVPTPAAPPESTPPTHLEPALAVPAPPCQGCGRRQWPLVYRTAGLVRYVTCALCGCHMKMTYSDDGKKIKEIQRI